MKKLAAALAALAVVTASSVALAGVVMVQKEEVTGAGHNHSLERTVMIQGNKEKMLTTTHEVITDLDKGAMYIIYPDRKMYLEIPFPPRGSMARMVGKPAYRSAKFKKTGKTRTAAGYKCEEYAGAGKFDNGNFSVEECVSRTVPGAADFLAFEKHMTAALKGSAYDTSANDLPEGVPLLQNAVTRVTSFSAPNLPPEAAARLKEELKKKPQIVSKVQVTKISAQKLPASTFEIPAGYTKQELPSGMGGPGHMMGHGMTGGGSSGTKK